jgi:hypothetical protein
MSNQSTEPTLIDAIRASLRQAMTTPTDTNGKEGGDHGNWSQLGEMIGGTVNRATAGTSSLSTGNPSAAPATTVKANLNRPTNSTATTPASKASVIAPAPTDAAQSSKPTPLTAGGSSSVDSGGKKQNGSSPMVGNFS